LTPLGSGIEDFIGHDETGRTRIILVQNFFEELKRLVPN